MLIPVGAIGLAWLPAITATPTPTIGMLVTRLAPIESRAPSITVALRDNLALKKTFENALEHIRTKSRLLSAEHAELIGYCAGEFVPPEYAHRKARCDQLNRQIAELQSEAQALMDREVKRGTEANILLARLAALKSESQALAVAAQAIPNATAQVATCGPTSPSASWATCMRNALCSVARGKADKSRQAIMVLRKELTTNRRELDYWGALNAQAQQDALKTALRFSLGEFAAGGQAQQRQLEKLVLETEALIKKARNTKKARLRTQYARQLLRKAQQMSGPTKDLLFREGAQAGLNIEQQWSVARDTIRTELKYSGDQARELKALLESPGFHEAFKTDQIDAPGSDLAGGIIEETLTRLDGRLAAIAGMEGRFAPHIRATVFVRDSGYNALSSLLSTQRVMQHADLAGSLAKASGVLQGRYAEDVLDLQACGQKSVV